MRSKEQAHDYRYFPDPDLTPIEFARADVERLRAALPELPYARFERYVDTLGLSVAQATQLVDNVSLADYFERAAAGAKDAQGTANFVLGELSRLANETGTSVAESFVTPESLAELVAMVEAKTINSKIAKEVLLRLWSEGGSAKALVEKEGLAQVSEPSAIAGFVDEVIAANEKVVADVRGGKDKSLQFLVGQVMKASRGKANPKLVEELLRQKISAT
jgi:aspartyl-tRNA(Asn)/glutamyl-tRNA(Gln) amidotransferase subunit B